MHRLFTVYSIKFDFLFIFFYTDFGTKNLNIYGSDSILPEEYVEEVLYNGVRYTIHHIKNSKEISSISTVVKKDNEEYYVDIIKGFVQEVEFEGKKVEGMRYNWFSKDKSLKFVENINTGLLVDRIFWQK
ncbi:hypothetical protein THYS13_22890 [Thermoanaerobacter sp. YS13]|uniref:hypothetical protein n=1 Tax=Thermoanaerobacter sp. YS13 TaxID=1511746 RepID=UPI0005733C8D|nr:hypothetical protein [Thermoanaerobacter sp. YS13]KHO61829.1 hypothetical protein THYS13_22890 [Thermoanaerobacter sp. YS13]